jgi:hypothetical protein
MKKMTYIASLFAFGLISGVAHADFNTELYGSVLKSDDLKLFALGGSYYFDQVNTNKGPLAEATFLDQQSSVDAVFTRFDFDEDNVNAWAIGGTYVLQGTGLYLNAAVSHVNGYLADIYSLGGGYYLSRDWAVSVNTEFDKDFNYQGFSLGSKKLFNLGGDTFVSLAGEYTNPDQSDDSFAVSSDFYLNRNLSVGLGYQWADSFSDGVSSVRSQWFINDKFAVSAEVSYADYDSGSDTNYMLGATMRF